MPSHMSSLNYHKVSKMNYISGVLLFSILGYSEGYNILVMMPLPLFSHTNSYLPLFTELAKRGHNVTMVSPFPLKEPVPNFNEIIIENIWEARQKKDPSNFDPRDYNGFLLRTIGPRIMCPQMMSGVMEIPEFKTFLNDTDSKFDLVITETFFCQEPLIAFGYKYGAIQVTIQTIALSMSEAHLTGNPYNPSYMPSFKFGITHRMNFWQRSKNTLVGLLDYVILRIGWIQMDYIMRKHLTYAGFENLPSLLDMLRNISLILVDNHISLSYPRPHLPNVIDFGVLTIQEGTKLPENLEKFMNESKDGVIYFSWGSHYKTTNMKPHTVAAFMSTFGKLKERVLMKVDEESLPGKPDNVLLANWVPQASVLAHPNMRVFISHGGLHGVAEAVYHGVPVLGTPLFADQDFNLKVLEEAGFCISINIDTATEEILSDAINRLLTNSSYKENALKRSKIMKDRPLSALDNAVYWVEYVLRHNGAPHLRSAAVDLPWYQFFLIDVLIVWGTIFVLIFILFCKLLKYTYMVCKSQKHLGKIFGKNKTE